MEDFFLIKRVHCATCYIFCATDQGGPHIVDKQGNAFCSSNCKRAFEVYIRLTKWAKRKAKRFPKGEVDWTKAQEYLGQYLAELRKFRTATTR